MSIASNGSSTSEAWDEVNVDDVILASPLDEAERGAFRESGGEITCDSPFAARQGKSLRFRNVYMEVRNATKTRKHEANMDGQTVILNGCWGSAPAGQVTAIIGSSGSGKTSLLNVLSGRQVSNPSTHQLVRCEVTLRNLPVDPGSVKVRKQIAFVAQEDSLQVTATPREAILFSARLRLPKTIPFAELRRLAETMVEELRLTKCADTLIGSSTLKGVSGGERKRTSVGVELVTQPSLVFLDEATSGLDSYNAFELVTVLKKVAQAGSTVLLTIHQPSSEIFSSLDNLIQLEKGEVLYAGEVQNVPSFFEQHGYPCPSHYNPADWVMNVAQTVSIEDLKAKGFFAVPSDEGSLSTTTEGFRTSSRQQRKSSQDKVKSHGRLHTLDDEKRAKSLHPGFFVQTKLLFLREVRNLHRNTKNLAARTAMTVMGSVLGGIIFFQVGKNSYTNFINLQSTFGGLLTSLLANVFSTALPSLVAFPEERPVFLREYSTNHYGVGAYFASRLTMEALVTATQACISTILTYFLMGLSAGYGTFWSVCYMLAMTSTALGVLVGCGVKDPGVAVEFLPMIFMPQILFSGFFVPPDLIPVWLRWLQYIFPLTYAVKLVMVAQFADTCNGLVPNYCDGILNNVKASPDDTWWYWIVLCSQFVVFRLVALMVLRLKASRFY